MYRQLTARHCCFWQFHTRSLTAQHLMQRQICVFCYRVTGCPNKIDPKVLSLVFLYKAGIKLRNNFGQVVHTYVPLSPIIITWYWSKDNDVLLLERSPQDWQKVVSAYRRGWLKSYLRTDWLPVHRDQLRAQRSVTSMGDFTFIFLYNDWLLKVNFWLTVLD